MKRNLGLVGLMLLTFVLVLAGGVAASSAGEPDPGTVQGVRGPSVFWNGTAIAGTTVTYTTVPKTIYGTDVSVIWMYHSADVFLTADVTTGKNITVTPQLSADGTNWADVNYNYVTDSAVAEATQKITMSADGTDYTRVTLAGKYLRFKIEHNAAVTPTITVLLRND